MDIPQQSSRNEGECVTKKRRLENTREIDKPYLKKQNLEPEANKSSAGSSKEEPPNQKLPYELLLILFSYLSIPDLVSVQRVCSGWRAAAQDKSLWKNYTLTIRGTPEDKRKVLLMPAVRNIAGEARNNFIKIILNHVMELVKLTCQFVPPLSSPQIRTIMRKFPKLEAVTLDISESNILKSLGLMKASKHIKEIYFTLHYNHYFTDHRNRRNSKHKSPATLMNIFSVFSDTKNFPGLTHIDVSEIYIWLAAAEEQAFVNVLVSIINQRSQQLLSLKVIVSNIECENFMNAINMCTNLHTLHIEFLGKDRFIRPVCLNIGRMTQLRSLSIHMLKATCHLPTFCDFLYNGSSSHLRELEILTPYEHFTYNMLQAVIQNFTGLRELTFRDNGSNTSENNLKEISRLSKLENLVIGGLNNFTEEGIGYLSQCKNLKYLVFYAVMSRMDNLNPLIASMLNQMKELDTLIFGIADHIVDLDHRGDIEKFICKNLRKVQ